MVEVLMEMVLVLSCQISSTATSRVCCAARQSCETDEEVRQSCESGTDEEVQADKVLGKVKDKGKVKIRKSCRSKGKVIRLLLVMMPNGAKSTAMRVRQQQPPWHPQW